MNDLPTQAEIVEALNELDEGFAPPLADQLSFVGAELLEAPPEGGRLVRATFTIDIPFLEEDDEDDEV